MKFKLNFLPLTICTNPNILFDNDPEIHCYCKYFQFNIVRMTANANADADADE